MKEEDDNSNEKRGDDALDLLNVNSSRVGIANSYFVAAKLRYWSLQWQTMEWQKPFFIFKLIRQTYLRMTEPMDERFRARWSLAASKFADSSSHWLRVSMDLREHINRSTRAPGFSLTDRNRFGLDLQTTDLDQSSSQWESERERVREAQRNYGPLKFESVAFERQRSWKGFY